MTYSGDLSQLCGQASCFLTLSDHITQPVRRYFKEDTNRRLSEFIVSKDAVGRRLSFYLFESTQQVVDLKHTAFLGRVAPVFSEADLNIVSREHDRLVRFVASRNNVESKRPFIIRNRRVNVRHGQV